MYKVMADVPEQKSLFLELGDIIRISDKRGYE